MIAPSCFFGRTRDIICCDFLDLHRNRCDSCLPSSSSIPSSSSLSLSFPLCSCVFSEKSASFITGIECRNNEELIFLKKIFLFVFCYSHYYFTTYIWDEGPLIILALTVKQFCHLFYLFLVIEFPTWSMICYHCICLLHVRLVLQFFRFSSCLIVHALGEDL